MNNNIKLIFCFLIIFSCNKNSKKTDQNLKLSPVPVLIKIGYYPTFHQPAETIINIKEKYLIFYSPTAYMPAPPPPPKENGEKRTAQEENEYKQYLMERPELFPFKSALLENDISIILKTIKTFSAKDFNDKDIQPAYDGMSTNTMILYSDGSIKQINPLNDPNEKQRKLYNEILNILIQKNDNKNDSIILQKINGYH